jgi:5-methylcytosine-specific restriction endonuclease McrA
MPIKKENKSRYPKDWKQIRASILERADNCCEFCGRRNHTTHINEKTGKVVKVVLTIAHLDHTPENCDPDNLRALCQKCHNAYDAKHRAETRRESMRKVGSWATLKAQLSTLREVAKTYGGRTIDNIIQNYEARLKYFEEKGGQ